MTGVQTCALPISKLRGGSHSEVRVCIVELSSIPTTCGLCHDHLRPLTPFTHNGGLCFFEIPTYVKGPSPFLLNPVYKGLYVFHSMYLSPIAQKTSSRVHIQTDELSVIVGSLVVICGIEPHGGISTNSAHETDPTPLSQYIIQI